MKNVLGKKKKNLSSVQDSKYHMLGNNNNSLTFYVEGQICFIYEDAEDFER